MGTIETKARNKHGPVGGRKRRSMPAGSSQLGGVQLDASKPLVSQLATALSASWGRVTSLFHEWDADGDGEIQSQSRSARRSQCVPCTVHRRGRCTPVRATVARRA